MKLKEIKVGKRFRKDIGSLEELKRSIQAPENYLKKFKLSKANEKQEVAREIFEYFKKQIAFGHLMSIVNRIGRQAIHEHFMETRKSECKDELKLFLWKCGRNYKEIRFE